MAFGFRKTATAVKKRRQTDGQIDRSLTTKNMLSFEDKN